MDAPRKALRSRIFLALCVSVFVCAGIFASVPAARSQAAQTQAATATAAKAQAKSKPANARPAAVTPDNENQAPLIIELYSLKVRFEQDGTGSRQFDVRVKANTAEGIKQLKSLAFDYNAANEKFALNFLRVTKPDGGTENAGPSGVTFGPAPAAKAAPAFSELREARVTVPPMSPGDTLSYEVVTSVVRPVAPGAFWFSHDFLRSEPAQDEELEISVPADVKIALRNAPQFPPKISTRAGRRIYSWKRLNAAPAPRHSGENTPRTPDVALTSFASWQELGKWFASNAKAATAISPELVAKAQQLTAANRTGAEKIRAIYDFVAKQIRLVRIPPEQTQYRIHDAAKILAAGYGDAYDKCGLLVALLQADGIAADVALAPAAEKWDAQFPWPGEIGTAVVVAHLAGDDFWMDPSRDTIPFRLLLPNARGKEALVASSSVAPHFEKTPLDPPFPSRQNVSISAQISSLGRLTAQVRYELRGDNEFALRTAFESTPQAEWNGLTQTMATLDGLHGTVSNAQPSDPADTREPFTIDFTLTAPNFLDWSQKSTLLPILLPTFGLPNPPANAAQPVQLGSPLDVSATLRLKLPANDFIHAPVGAGVTRDYAVYQSQYSATEHTLTAKRTLRFIARELPAARREDYRAFAEAVQADQAQGLAVKNIIPGVPDDATTAQLMSAGASEMQAGRYANALQLFDQVRHINSQQPNLWLDMGAAQLQLGHYDDAIASLRKQLAANPKDDRVNNLLGLAYFGEKKYSQAEDEFNQQLALKPLDKNAYAYLGAVYNAGKKYAAARAELEKAAVLDPQNAIVQLRLGEADLGLGKTDAALAAFDKAASFSPTPVVNNDIAYTLAEHKVALDRAEEYADSAVHATEASLANVDLQHLNGNNLEAMSALPAFWDTLGWVYFQQGKMAQAEQEISAAWRLNQMASVANHLGQIYEARGESQRAAVAFAESLAAGNAPAGTRAQLRRLLGPAATDAAIAARVSRAKTQMVRERTIFLGKAPADGKAELAVMVAAGPRGAAVREAKFIAGSTKLAPLVDRLQTAPFAPILPSGTNAHIVLRGIASCSLQTARCEFVFDRPRDFFTPQK